MERKKIRLNAQKNFTQFQFNIENVSKMFNNKKYQLMGTYPNNKDFIEDIKRLHKKWGYEIRTERISTQHIKVWTRKVKTIRDIKLSNNIKYL